MEGKYLNYMNSNPLCVCLKVFKHVSMYAVFPSLLC